MNAQARRPNLTGRTPRPVVACPKCGEVRRLFTSQSCKPCWTKDNPTPEGECAACHRWMKLPARGLCDRCAHVLPPGSGTNGQRRVVSNRDATDAARLHEEFVKVVAPRVTRHTYFRSQRALNGPDREELAAEAVALAWEVYLQERKRGQNPLNHVRMFVRRVVGKAIFGCSVAGKMRTDDVLSRKRRDLRHAVVLTLTAWRTATYKAPDTAGEIDACAWIEKLPAPERQVVEFMSLGNGWPEVKARFGLKNSWHVNKLLDRLWALAQELRK